MTSHLLRNTRLYTRQLNEQEMDILAAWLETLDPVNPGEEAAEVTVVLHHSLRQNNKVNAASARNKTPPESFSVYSHPRHSEARIGSRRTAIDNNSGIHPHSTRSEGNISPDWKQNSRQMKSFRPPPIFIPGMPNLPEIQKHDKVNSIDKRISPEIIRMPAPDVNPVTAIRSRCPPTILSNDITKTGGKGISISSNPPPRQSEKLESRVANWVRNTSSNSSYLGHESQKSSSKGTSVLPVRPHDSVNDPAILALMTAVVEEKKVEEARTSPRLIGSSECLTYARSNPSTSYRDRNLPSNGRPRGYPYLKSDLHRATGRLGIYQPDILFSYSQT
ncbi:hypothetical protein SBOR_9365 [Sclerotinia borealis F-4128]|uniref:Uncharacterized protein n=1 Tax=Sclerotinia borealis (strain F-4128) TaxID=1432307 RepID=W9C095_SCLBF|nr:hypothetical protein SBOR_9365 [Sclerotinia borealis F-4128]